MARPVLGVLFGGKSNEHDVSLLSAAAISYVASALASLAVRRIPVVGKWIC